MSQSSAASNFFKRKWSPWVAHSVTVVVDSGLGIFTGCSSHKLGNPPAHSLLLYVTFTAPKTSWACSWWKSSGTMRTLKMSAHNKQQLAIASLSQAKTEESLRRTPNASEQTRATRTGKQRKKHTQHKNDLKKCPFTGLLVFVPTLHGLNLSSQLHFVCTFS